MAYACDEYANVCIRAGESLLKRLVCSAALSIGGEICFFLKKLKKIVVTVTVTTIKFKKLAPTHPTRFRKVSPFKQPKPPRIPKSFL